MRKAPLTDLKVRSLKADGETRIEVWDAVMPAFGVRVSPHGTKSFVLMYRFDGRLRRQTLGRYPALKLADARAKAQDILSRVEAGDDPQESNNDSGSGNTCRFSLILDDFLRLHCARHNKPSTIRSTTRLLTNEFLPHWQDRDTAQITKADILKILDGMVERGAPGAANHAYAAISKFFSWCSSRDIIAANPCADVKRPSKLNARDRILNDAELGRIWHAAIETGYPFGAIVQLLLLTGQRRGEVVNMCRSHVDASDEVWNIPSELTKSSRAHVVPLSNTTSQLIAALPQLHDEFLFPALGSSSTTFSGFGKAKQRLDRLSNVSDWTLHDLRRTAATGMAGLGIAPHIVERVLNHSSGTFAGVAGVYNRFQYIDEMRDALKKWETHLLNLPQTKF